MDSEAEITEAELSAVGEPCGAMFLAYSKVKRETHSQLWELKERNNVNDN